MEKITVNNCVVDQMKVIMILIDNLRHTTTLFGEMYADENYKAIISLVNYYVIIHTDFCLQCTCRRWTHTLHNRVQGILIMFIVGNIS